MMPAGAGEIYTLQDLSVWYFAGKGFLSIDSDLFERRFASFDECHFTRFHLRISVLLVAGFLLTKRSCVTKRCWWITI